MSIISSASTLSTANIFAACVCVYVLLGILRKESQRFDDNERNERVRAIVCYFHSLFEMPHAFCSLIFCVCFEMHSIDKCVAQFPWFKQTVIYIDGCVFKRPSRTEDF